MFQITHYNRAERPSKAAPAYESEENFFARNPILLLHVADERAVSPLTARERKNLVGLAEQAFPGRQFFILPDTVASVGVSDESGRVWRYRIEELAGRPITLEGRCADPDYEGQTWRAILTPCIPWAPWKLVRLCEEMPWQAPEQRQTAREMVTRMIYAACGRDDYRIGGMDLRFARAVPIRTEVPRPVRNRRQTAGRRL